MRGSHAPKADPTPGEVSVQPRPERDESQEERKDDRDHEDELLKL
jgi:hypothetical protein